MFVKICGLTRPGDVAASVEHGATHVGFVLAAASPRRVPAEEVRSLLREVPASVTPVLVFRDARPVEVLRLVDRVGSPTPVQLHRFHESDARSLEERGLVVHRARDARTLDPSRIRASRNRIVHLDVGGGGTGARFSWETLAPRSPSYCFVAGGITPDNLEELLPLRPWGIDLSSGLEIRPGVKDLARIERLFRVLHQTPIGVPLP